MAEEVIQAYYCSICGQRVIPLESSANRFRHVRHDSDVDHAALPKQIKGTIRPDKLG